MVDEDVCREARWFEVELAGRMKVDRGQRRERIVVMGSGGGHHV